MRTSFMKALIPFMRRGINIPSIALPFVCLVWKVAICKYKTNEQTNKQQEATASRQANIFNVRECLEELKQSVPDYMGIQERNH